MQQAYAAVLAATVISAQPLVDDSVLEPSVLNEVVHAVSRAPTNGACCVRARGEAVRALLGEDGLSATEAAIRLVSAQRGDGRWFVGTNDVTAAAVDFLRRISGEDSSAPALSGARFPRDDD